MSAAAGFKDDGSLRLARLPPGRHGLPREYVTRNQRDRLAAGTIAVVAERGLNQATITQICAAAGVSRRTFYTYFSSKEECYRAAYGTVVEHLREATDAAGEEAATWPEQVRLKIESALQFLAMNPDLARFLVIAPQRAGEEIAIAYHRAMEGVLRNLCEGRPPSEDDGPSEAVAASLVGGMVSLVVREVERGDGEKLPRLTPDLVEFFLTPYVGRTEAVRAARTQG